MEIFNNNFIDNSFKDPTPKVTQQLLENLLRMSWTEDMLENFLSEALDKGEIKCYDDMLLNEWNEAIWNPARKYPMEYEEYSTNEDNWNELNYQEKQDRINGVEVTTPGFIDLNKENFDKLVDNLEKNIRYKSDSETYIISKLIEFYKMKSI